MSSWEAGSRVSASTRSLRSSNSIHEISPSSAFSAPLWDAPAPSQRGLPACSRLFLLRSPVVDFVSPDGCAMSPLTRTLALKGAPRTSHITTNQRLKCRGDSILPLFCLQRCFIFRDRAQRVNEARPAPVELGPTGPAAESLPTLIPTPRHPPSSRRDAALPAPPVPPHSCLPSPSGPWRPRRKAPMGPE